MDTLVIAVMVVLVLLVVSFIFKDFIFGVSKGLFQIRDESIGQVEGSKCSSLFGERKCFSQCPTPTDTADFYYTQVYGEFTDCPQKLADGSMKKDKDGKELNVCCERVRKEG